MVIVLVSPFVLQLPLAEAIATVPGPVIRKSLPLTAIELQSILSGKVSVKLLGEHPGLVIVPIGSGG